MGSLVKPPASPVITEKPLQGLIAGVVDNGDKFIAGFSSTPVNSL
jgi:hypothetical protein